MLRFTRTRVPVLFILLTLTCCLGACIPAFAAEMIPAHAPATSPAADALVGFLNSVVFPLLSAAALGYLTIWLNRMGEKWQIKALADKNSFIFKLAGQGIALAEERAAKLAGSVSTLTGSDKLDIAVGHVLKNFPRLSHEQAQDIVHSMLAQIPGAGASGEAVTLLPQEGGYSVGKPIDAAALVPVEVPAAP